MHSPLHAPHYRPAARVHLDVVGEVRALRLAALQLPLRVRELAHGGGGATGQLRA